MADEVIVQNNISRYGLRQLHLISSQPVDLDEQIRAHVGDGKVEAWLEYEEEELRLYHLYLYWRMEDEQEWPVSNLRKYAEKGGAVNGS